MYIIKEDHEGDEENKTETMLLENFRALTKDDQEYFATDHGNIAAEILLSNCSYLWAGSQ